MVRFLIIRFSSIGDIVLTTPVIRCLKLQVEEAEVHFLTKPEYADILRSNPYVDRVLTLKEKFRDTVSEIRDEQYDYIIDLHNSLRSRRLKATLKIIDFTVRKLNWQKWLLVNFRINKLPALHIVDRYLETTHVFDAENDHKGLDYFIPEKEEVDQSVFPEKYKNGYVALVVGAKHMTKRLPVEKIIELTKKIELPVVLLGGKEDEALGEKVVAESGTTCFNACGKFNLNQSASVVKSAQVVISHDTGMMHIAAAFKKNIISVWGNTVPAFGMYPYLPGEKSHIMEVEGLKCRPCTKLGFSACPKKHFRCMQDQDIEKIASLVNNCCK